jgi:hypothetical protein
MRSSTSKGLRTFGRSSPSLKALRTSSLTSCSPAGAQLRPPAPKDHVLSKDVIMSPVTDELRLLRSPWNFGDGGPGVIVT